MNSHKSTFIVFRQYLKAMGKNHLKTIHMPFGMNPESGRNWFNGYVYWLWIFTDIFGKKTRQTHSVN